MNRPAFLAALMAGASILSSADHATRVVHYHANDIVAIRAKMRYTTLIEVPTGEKIMEAATGDKDFWIIEAVQNYCFLHPAKAGIHSNLNLITDKGNVYSFTLDETGDGEPDLKVLIEPSDPSLVSAINSRSRSLCRRVMSRSSGRRPRQHSSVQASSLHDSKASTRPNL